MWWYLRKNASFPLSVLFRKSYLEYFYSFRAKETYLKTPDSLNQGSQTTDFTSSPAVKTDTALELTDCQDVSSAHENLILVVFSICWPQFPRVHILRGPETRKGEAEEEPEEGCPQTASGTFLLERRWDLELPGKPVQGLLKARTWLKVRKPYGIEVFFPFCCLGPKGIEGFRNLSLQGHWIFVSQSRPELPPSLFLSQINLWGDTHEE